MALRYIWPRGGSRILARGSADNLKAHLLQVLQSGGPYGGPESEPPRAGRRVVITGWEGPTLDRQGLDVQLRRWL
jgi:hypothetical protein